MLALGRNLARFTTSTMNSAATPSMKTLQAAMKEKETVEERTIQATKNTLSPYVVAEPAKPYYSGCGLYYNSERFKKTEQTDVKDT